MGSYLINNIYSEKITILNKIQGKHTPDGGSDFWVKYVYPCAAWSSKSLSSINGSTVNIGTKTIVLLSNLDNYKPYEEFCRLGGFGDYFTMSLNDYIVKGVVTEEINSSTITKVLSKYEPYSIRVQSIIHTPSRSFQCAKLKIEGV